jgi:putative peptidoglycan lipid II flippase
MSERSQIARSTGILGLATGLSRIGGLIRDMVVAAVFGAGFVTDAFFVAFTIPNLLRRFFAEGSLTAAFVPTFSEIYHQQGNDEARRVANICWTLLLLVVAGVVVVGIIGSPLMVKLIGYGFSAVPGKLELTDQLNRVMFPYIFFVSLLALVTGVLNVQKHFFWPAVSPLVLNLSMIFSALLLTPWFSRPIMALAVGVLLGGVLQLVMQTPVLIRYGFFPRLDFSFRHPAVKRISLLMLPGVAGVAIYQVNVIVTRLLASFLPEGSVSYLYYGQRLFEFPQGVFIVSLAQAVLPAFSRQSADRDWDGLQQSLRFSIYLVLIVTLPAALGLVLCAKPVFGLLFMRGAFDENAVRQTALALMAFAPGLVFVGVSRMLVSSFYALKDTRTPVMISFWTLLINAGSGLILMQFFGHVGLALGLTLSAIFNSLALACRLRAKLALPSVAELSELLLRQLLPLLMMLLVVSGLLGLVDWTHSGQLFGRGLLLVLAVGCGTVVYGFGCLMCRVPESAETWKLLQRKLFRRSA